MREEAGLSQQEAARGLGIPHTRFQRWEDPAKCKLTVATLADIARVFGRKPEISFC